MKNALLLTLALACAPQAFAARHEVASPDGDLVLALEAAAGLAVSIRYKGKEALAPSAIALSVEGRETFGRRPKLLSAVESSRDAVEKPVIRRKFASIPDRYNALTLSFEGGYAVELRAYDDGVAYRFATELGGEIEVRSETMELRFPEGSSSYFPEEESMISHNERLYPNVDLAEIGADRFCSLPVMVDTPQVARIVFTEADLFDYPAMYLKGGDGASLNATFPMRVLETRPAADGPDRNVEIVEEADDIAKTDGARVFPWRVFVVSDDDATFLLSELVYLLSRPLQISDTDWIKPGRVAWDWYNANNIVGVDFESGLNNDTYKYYIDFASKYGLEYVILDEGWSKTTLNVAEPNPDIDVPELVAYGKERGVDIILWSLWTPMWEGAPALFDLYREWGVKGVKIDFMQRSDQAMVNFYERVARQAAERELLVDYHGAFKPAGLRRALPNVVSYEGVKGSENNKWSSDITPEHNVTIPFIRMVAGPMDYTPGAMVNTIPGNHRISHFRPMGIGTRAHEVAKYVVFESALQMLCDSPSLYLQDRKTVEFIAQIPSVWDDTKVIEAKVADYVVVARQREGRWYVGAMTDGSARSFDLDLGFLGGGAWKAQIFQDGVNADKHAEDYKSFKVRVGPGEPLRAELAPNGGWAAILVPER